MPSKTDEDCLIKGKCKIHDLEIERRRFDRKDLDALKINFKDLDEGNEARFIAIHNRVNGIENKTVAVFLSLTLLAAIVFGGYYYTNTVDTRNDRGEEILLTKINADYKSAKDERVNLVNQVVSLLTADAERKEWQRGMITQLELLNDHIKTLAEIKNPEVRNNGN